MKKMFLLVVMVLLVGLILVGCKEEETPTPIEIDIEVSELIDIFNVHTYELVIIHERKEVSGGYSYGVKKSGQGYYDKDDNLWLFSTDYILTGSQAVLITIDDTHYVLKVTSGR